LVISWHKPIADKQGAATTTTLKTRRRNVEPRESVLIMRFSNPRFGRREFVDPPSSSSILGFGFYFI
jgi:hypothetical protein